MISCIYTHTAHSPIFYPSKILPYTVYHLCKFSIPILVLDTNLLCIATQLPMATWLALMKGFTVEYHFYCTSEITVLSCLQVTSR